MVQIIHELGPQRLAATGYKYRQLKALIRTTPGLSISESVLESRCRKIKAASADIMYIHRLVLAVSSSLTRTGQTATSSMAISSRFSSRRTETTNDTVEPAHGQASQPACSNANKTAPNHQTTALVMATQLLFLIYWPQTTAAEGVLRIAHLVDNLG